MRATSHIIRACVARFAVCAGATLNLRQEANINVRQVSIEEVERTSSCLKPIKNVAYQSPASLAAILKERRAGLLGRSYARYLKESHHVCGDVEAHLHLSPLSKWWQQHAKASGLNGNAETPPGGHDLRHTFATMLPEQPIQRQRKTFSDTRISI